MSEFLRPKLGLSTRMMERRKLGAYPKTVKAQEENDFLAFPKMKGSTTSWPKQMKLMENQAKERQMVVRIQQELNRDLIAAFYLPSNVLLQYCTTSSFYSLETVSLEPGLLSKIISFRIQQAESKFLWAIKQRGDYLRVKKDPSKTKMFGTQLQIIISRQLPDVKVSKKMYARSKPQSLPIETKKLSKRIPLPRYLAGVISAKTLVVIAMVNPQVKPQMNRARIIWWQVSTKRNRELTRICSTDPLMIMGLRPQLSDSLPVVMEPKNTPRQKIEARVEAWLWESCHSACTIGVRNEPKQHCFKFTQDQLGSVIQVNQTQKEQWVVLGRPDPDFIIEN